MKKLFEGAILSLIVLLLLPGIRTEAADGRTIASGVYIGDVNVSNMAVTAAQEAIDSYIQKGRESDITLDAGDGRNIVIKGSDLGLYWDNKEVVEDAYALGHKGNIVKRYKALKDLERNNYRFDLKVGIDDEAVRNLVLDRCSVFNQEKKNYSLAKTSEGFVVTQGQTGYVVDTEASVAAIKDYIQNGWNAENATIALVIKEDAPLGAGEDLSKVKDVLGTFTTSYKTSGASRSANVANGCSLIDGTTLYPGEEFSVLDAITPFTEANGYFPAGSYLNGIVVESIGGGICQVSTTLYNAVLLAELDVTERHNHSMIVNYVKPSADAAIAESGGKNFKFVNSTEYPIYIEGKTTPDKQITFTIYGVETRDPGHKVTFESEVLETIPASEDSYVTTATEGIGYVGIQSAHIGYKARLKKIVSENGSVVSEEVVNNSNYKMVPRIITVGTAGADAIAMGQLQTAIATKDVGTVKAVAGALLAASKAAGTEGAESATAAVNDAVNAAHAQIQQQQEAAAAAAAAAAAQAEAPTETPAPAPEAPTEQAQEDVESIVTG